MEDLQRLSDWVGVHCKLMAMEKFDFFYYILVNLKMIVSKTTLLKWNNANKKRYVDLGYRFTQCGDEFEVDINDLSKSCTAYNSHQRLLPSLLV